MPFTTSDLSRRSGDIITEALRRPVTLTQRGKPRLIVISIEEYERLLHANPDARRAYKVDELPEDLLAAAEKALVAYEKEDDDRS